MHLTKWADKLMGSFLPPVRSVGESGQENAINRTFSYIVSSFTPCLNTVTGITIKDKELQLTFLLLLCLLPRGANCNLTLHENTSCLT